MLVPLAEATAAACGGKAAALGAMLRAGLPVPDGFVVPFAVHRAATDGGATPTARHACPEAARAVLDRRSDLPDPVLQALARALDRLGDPPVAVRSSAAGEDADDASAAGQYETVLGVRGLPAVAAAVGACWASLRSARAVDYRSRTPGGTGAGPAAMAVIVQRHLDAEVSGVMFTPAGPGEATVIEAAWGLGPSVVGGRVTPDTFRVGADGSVAGTVADKRTRLDRVGIQLVAREVPVGHRRRTTLDEATARELATLGERAAALLGGPQDLEWAITEDGGLWLLQSRPITVTLPAPPPAPDTDVGPVTLTGVPGSHGTVTGPARAVRGPRDFARVRPGDILVCPFTDPAWTPLLAMAAGVVTETGGVLSHAAIVARERGIPAVLGVADAVDAIPDGTTITIDGTAGTVTPSDA